MTLCRSFANSVHTDLDPVQACILSIATNHSAEADSITRPHIGAQRELIDRVLREAGVPGCSISYAEMHGTGTQVSCKKTSGQCSTDYADHNSTKGRRCG